MTANEQTNTPAPRKIGKTTLRRRKHVAEKRATAQRTKLDAQAQARAHQAAEKAVEAATSKPKGRHDQQRLQASRRASTTIARAVDDYLQDHAGGNHSDKTLEWHRTALGLMLTYLEQERDISLVGEVDAHLRTSPGGHGKLRSERTIQTYARSARAFFHWLVRREILQNNPFDRVTFPKVGKPLIQTIEAEEFERLLVACTPTNESGPIAERAAARNRAILWVLYDTGIRISELCGLRIAVFDRKRGVLTVTGKGSKERRTVKDREALSKLQASALDGLDETGESIRGGIMSLERTEGQRDSMHVGHYLVTFDGAGAYIEHRSTHASYRVQVATATNAVDFMKHHKRLIFALMRNAPGELESYQVQQHTEGHPE